MVASYQRFDLSNPNTLILDLEHPSPKDLRTVHQVFERAMETVPHNGKVPLKTGWHTLNPGQIIDLLLRNRPGANRHLDPATVFYYAEQMARHDWKATGQPIIFDKAGILEDGQHRLYAALIAGVSFYTFVVTDIEPVENLFAYIDNGRARSAAAALQTAGLNGVSPIVAKVIKFAEEVKHGIYNKSGATRLARISPAQILNLAKQYPNVHAACRAAASDWATAVELAGRKDILAYVGMRICDLYSEETADEFFADLTDRSLVLEQDDPALALRTVLEKDRKSEKPMKRQYVAAVFILAFNAWQQQAKLQKRWVQSVIDDFPAFIEGDDEDQQAAE